MTHRPSEQPSLARTIVDKWFRAADDDLVVGGRRIVDLVAQFGTPVYIYDASVMTARLAELRQAFGTPFEIYYSIKANPNPNVVRFFVEQGVGLEIASAGELNLAIEGGCSARKIVFAGPGKSDAELRASLELGVGELHVESLSEATRLNQIACALDVVAKICLRVNPLSDVQGGAMQMGGRPTQFGIDEEKVSAVVSTLETLDNLDLHGIHLFTGTQNLDHAILAKQYDRCVDLAEKLATQIDRPLRSIDFGGGLGVPYFPHEQELDLRRLSADVLRLIDRIRSNQLLKDARLILEPGRFLTADAGMYVTRIRDIKQSREKTFAIVDGGMHHHLAASGNLGQTIKRNYPIVNLSKMDHAANESQPIELVGPLCTPLDKLGRGVQLPQSEIGDLIGILRSGAYGLSASPMGFLSHTPPIELFVHDKSVIANRVSLHRDQIQH